MAAVLVLVGAVLYGIAEPPGRSGWMATIAVAPLILAASTGTLLGGAICGLAYGTVSGLFLAHWILGGLERLGADAVHAAVGTLAVALWGAGLPWALLGALVAGLRRTPPEVRIALTALGGFAIDSARSCGVLGIPWGMLGHSQWSVPGVAQVVTLGGIPFVSSLVLTVNASLAEVCRARMDSEKRRRALRVLATAGGAYLAVAALGLYVSTRVGETASAGSPAGLSILLVQPNLDPKERWSSLVQRSNLEAISRWTTRAINEQGEPPDLVVWPENTLTDGLLENHDLRAALERKVDEFRVPLITGAVARGSARSRAVQSSAFWVEPGSGIVARLDKRVAIPVIEADKAFPGDQIVGAVFGLDPERPRAMGGGVAGPLKHGQSEFAVVLCYEGLFAGVVASRRSPDTIAILNLGNDSWFLSAIPSAQQVAIMSFRAIEQRLWLIRSVYGGASSVIDPYGREIQNLPFGQRGSIRAILGRPLDHGLRTSIAIALSVLLAAGGLGGWLCAQLAQRRLGNG